MQRRGILQMRIVRLRMLVRMRGFANKKGRTDKFTSSEKNGEIECGEQGTTL